MTARKEAEEVEAEAAVAVARGGYRREGSSISVARCLFGRPFAALESEVRFISEGKSSQDEGKGGLIAC